MRKAIPTLVVARAIMHDVTPWDGTMPPVADIAPQAPVPYVAPVPVPVVATPTPKPVPVDRAIQDPAPTPAPVVVAGVTVKTYTRGAPYKCPKCKRMVPVGGSVACDSKGKLVCLTCIGAAAPAPVDRAVPAVPAPAVKVYKSGPYPSHKAAAEAMAAESPPIGKRPAAIAQAPAPKPAAATTVPEIKPARYASDCPACKQRIGAGDLIRRNAKGEPWTHATCPTVTPTDDKPEAKYDAHVLDRECIERAYAKRDADDAARLAALQPVVTCGKCGTTAGTMVRSPRGRMFCGKCAAELQARAAKSAPVAKPAAPKGTVLDAFMLDDLVRALDAVRSTPESVDDVGKTAETALDALLAAIDDEEPIVDKCLEDATDLLTEYEEPETTVEAVRARMDEARTKMQSVTDAVTHMVRMLRDAHGEAKSAVEDLANLQQRNAEESEALDVEALVREFEYRGYRIERVKR